MNEVGQYFALIIIMLIKPAININKFSKYSKCTLYLSRLSGCAKMVKRGLEISGIGIIAIDIHTCLHLEAVQTPSIQTLNQVRCILIDWYLKLSCLKMDKKGYFRSSSILAR